MALVEPMPESIENVLKARGDDPDSLLAAVAADLTATGTYGEEWLILTSKRLCVIPINGSEPQPSYDVALDEELKISSRTMKIA